MLRRLLATSPDRAILLIRLMVGIVFLSEGLQKWLFPAARGAGRFAKIGLPNPEFLGYVVGSLETVCGALVLLGLLTRVAVLPLLGIMAVALLSTKLPILLEKGVWELLHEARTDLCMVLGSLFLLLRGSGAPSVDHAWLLQKPGKLPEP